MSPICWLVRYLALLSGLHLLFATNAEGAEPFPALTIPGNFGVSIHHIEDKREFDMIAEAGFRIVRSDITWERIETTRGKYDWSHYDERLSEIAARGLRPLLILSYSNPLYEPEVSVKRANGSTARRVKAPVSPPAVAAFAAWARAAAARYAKYRPIWEIWNEPEFDFFWPPQVGVDEYVSLAKATCAAIREVDPTAAVIGPGAAKSPKDGDSNPQFLDSMLASGIGACLDGVSVHPYLWVRALPRTPELWRNLHDIIARHSGNNGKRPQPINSEWGLSTFGGKISDSVQASYLVRMMLLNLASAVPVSIWYDWRDDGDDANNPEHRFGVIRHNLERKPAWHAMRAMTQELRGQRVACTSMHVSPGDTVLILEGGDAYRRHMVVWNGESEGGRRLHLGVGARVLRATDMEGRAVSAAQPSGGYGFVHVDHRPLYLDIELQSVEGAKALCSG